jgi:copper chaperone CopZ
MKYLLMLALCGCLMIVGCTAAEEPAPEETETPAGTETQSNADAHEPEAVAMTLNLKIEGMFCVNCKAKVENILLEIPGVESAEADNENHTATVKLAPGANFDEDAARDKLDIENFDLKEVTPSP